MNPDEVSLILNNATLCNRKEAAKRINEGHNKYVCSWIECESYGLFNFKLSCLTDTELQYNPRVAPFWRDIDGNDIDGHSFEQIVTTGNKVFKSW